MPRINSWSPAVIASLLALGLRAVADPGAPQKQDTDWPLIGGNDYEQHYSPLTQINAGNVKNLKLAWYADMPTRDGLTGVPIVIDGVVYQSGGLGKAWAHSARTGKLLWEFDAGIKFPLGVVPSWGARLSRGLAVWDDKVLKASGDCRLFAIDRKTGWKRWEAQACDPAEYRTITGAPRVGDGKVFMGNANADSGVGRGYVDAYDIATGKRLWRFYTMPGDPALGFEDDAMAMAAKTWGKEYWKTVGGGSTWEGITYDPRTDLVYIGTDGPSPVSPSERPPGGDELFMNAIVAVNADTGEYVWHYTTTPQDGWNYAATFPVILADLTFDGERREVILNAPKNGFFYVHDARTGELLNEPKPIIPINWASRIDMSSGRPVVNVDAQYWLKGDSGPAVVSPSSMGARNWMPMSFSPQTGLVYIPTTDYAMAVKIDRTNLVGGLDIDFYHAEKHGMSFKGELLAWDPIAQIPRWRVDIGRPYQGGTLATAGNLVFQGTTGGRFNAWRADTGELLWSFRAGSGILGAPSTVTVDGEQLVLVPAGTGSTSSVIFAPDFADRADGPARLLAFSLSGNASLPATPVSAPPPLPQPAAPQPHADLALKGKAIWDALGCELCHGVRVQGGIGSVPDLRRMTPEKYTVFSEVVRGGALLASGMPVFGEWLTEDELPALKAYIIEQAWIAYRAEQRDGQISTP